MNTLIIDRFECGRCPFEVLYMRDHLTSSMSKCPQCANEGIYLKVEVAWVFEETFKKKDIKLD
jgi:predicted Zn-ribbon and HTH transcriptional regulator